MSAERLNKLEQGLVRMEGAMGSLTDKMTDIAGSMGEISKAVTTLAVVDVRMTDIDKSVDNLANAHRALAAKVELHNAQNIVMHTDTTDTADKNGWRRFSLALTFVVGVFGYLYIDIQSTESGHTEVSKELKTITNKLEEYKGNFKLIEEKLKKANGHRYYIQVEDRTALKNYIDGTHKGTE